MCPQNNGIRSALHLCSFLHPNHNSSLIIRKPSDKPNQEPVYKIPDWYFSVLSRSPGGGGGGEKPRRKKKKLISCHRTGKAEEVQQNTMWYTGLHPGTREARKWKD